MSNAHINQDFLAATDHQVKALVLDAIAAHYAISAEEAFQEVIGEDAEHLLDYLQGPFRASVSVLMQRQARQIPQRFVQRHGQRLASA